MCAIMLAHNGLALITEKLQKQRLEEFPPIICDAHMSQVATSLADTTSRHQARLTLKGKNLWTLQKETDRLRPKELSTEDSATPLPTENPEKTHLTFCRYEKLRQVCGAYDSALGVPAAPPKKKRCRSLSGPPECQMAVPAPAVEYIGKLWKPIAMMPSQINNNTVTTRNYESNTDLPYKTTGFKILPVISPSLSTDYSCFTNSIQTSSRLCYTNSIQTSSSGCCINSIKTSSSDYSVNCTKTSSGSPIPRPASAASDTSFSSIWQDCSPKNSRVRILENRSLSCEDQISGSSSVNPTTSGVQIKSNSCAKSGLPRCHSQPCILHHRRCGKKRRHDFQRPTLNFHKMTETAYTKAHVPMQDDSRDIPSTKQQVNADGCTDLRFDQNLSGSSSIESELPSLPRLFNTDLRIPEPLALHVTPPMYTSPNFIRPLNSRDQEDDYERYGSLVEEEDRCFHQRDCNCYNSRTNTGVELFRMIDLDIVEIESH